MKRAIWILTLLVLVVLADLNTAMAYLEEGYEFKKPGPAASRRLRAPGEGEEVRITQQASFEEYEEEVEIFVINLKDVGIRFATKKWTLDKKSEDRVRKIGELLAKYPELWTKLKLEGHTDNRGSEKYNMNLSKKRVQTVYRLLSEEFADKGIKKKRVKYFAFGETRPIDKADNEVAWEKNRRVELKLYGIEEDSDLAVELLALFYGNASKVPSKLVAKSKKKKICNKVCKRKKLIAQASKVITKKDRTLKINLYQAGVHFALDKDTLGKSGRTKLEQVAWLLNKYDKQWKDLELGGHTDIRGTLTYNMNLSKRRVRTVSEVLNGKGIATARMSAKAYGPNKPLINEMNEFAWAKNRRVELLLTGVDADSKLAKALESLFAREKIKTKRTKATRVQSKVARVLPKKKS